MTPVFKKDLKILSSDNVPIMQRIEHYQLAFVNL